MLHNITTVSVRVFHVFFPVLTMTFAMHLISEQTACRHRSALMDHNIGPEAVHDVGVGEFSTVMGMRIPKVLSTHRKNVL